MQTCNKKKRHGQEKPKQIELHLFTFNLFTDDINTFVHMF